MGDMNAKDEEHLRFQKEGFNIANGGLQVFLRTSKGALDLSGYKGGVNTNLDNIITSKNIKVMNISAPQPVLNYQDHLPIVADLVITW